MTVLSKTNYILQVNTLLADNSSRDISPQDLRSCFEDLVDSIPTFLVDETVETQELFLSNGNTILGDYSIRNYNLYKDEQSNNTSIGFFSMGNNYNGDDCTSIGAYSQACALYGSGNTSAGYRSLSSSIRGSGNAAFGSHSLTSNTQGNFNVALGYGAGYYSNFDESNKLYIAVHPEASGSCGVPSSPDSRPLVYGDFSTGQFGINVSGFPSDDAVVISGNVVPEATDQFSLGTTSLRWDGFFDHINTNSLQIGGTPMTVEGFMTEEIQPPDSFTAGRSGLMTIRDENQSEAGQVYIVNRDTELGISGCKYVVAQYVNGEYRPVYVGCSGCP